MSKKRVLLGMSGGVDSSVVAMMLQNDGFEVIGVTFVFSDLEKQNEIIVREAKQLADKLNIRHVVSDLRNEFNNLIISYFISEYQKGKTPFPCAKCNPEVKFKNLVKYAELYECDYIATGHYAKVADYNNNKYIFTGNDPEKDQSFFLWGLNKKILDKLILPLGPLKKTDTRKYANLLGFNTLSKKRDSLGICFIEGNNYRKFLDSKEIESTPGYFVDRKGKILGKHSGIINYTVGQRRGLGINLNNPAFVYDINPKNNEIILAEYDDLYKNKLIVGELNFTDIQEITFDKIFILKIRYRLQNTPCRIELLDKKRANIHLLEPLAMVANGQTAVFYDDNRVVGGGFIESSE